MVSKQKDGKTKLKEEIMQPMGGCQFSTTRQIFFFFHQSNRSNIESRITRTCVKGELRHSSGRTTIC